MSNNSKYSKDIKSVPISPHPRRLARKVAKANMQKAGITRVNRRMYNLWRSYWHIT